MAKAPPPDEEKEYHCQKWPAHLLVMVSKAKDVQHQHIQFVSGVFVTKDPEEIAYIEGHQDFKRGYIYLAEAKASSERAAAVKKLGDEAAALGYKLVKT